MSEPLPKINTVVIGEDGHAWLSVCIEEGEYVDSRKWLVGAEARALQARVEAAGGLAVVAPKALSPIIDLGMCQLQADAENAANAMRQHRGKRR
jgi:hypothetical protein